MEREERKKMVFNDARSFINGWHRFTEYFL
jgi:hypothetical protein